MGLSAEIDESPLGKFDAEIEVVGVGFLVSRVSELPFLF